MFTHLIAALILLALACAGPALAAGEGGADCSGPKDPDTFVVADPDGFIKDCTLIIEGAGTPREKSVALINRASATRAKTISGKSNDGLADRAAAAADLDEAVRLDPTFAFAFYARGLSGFFDPRRDGLEDFNEAIRLDPNFALAYIGRARAYSRKNHYRRAEADYSAAIRLDANLARAFLGRGGARRMNGDDDGAIADFSKALSLSANLRDAVERNLSIRAAESRGLAYFARGEFDLAVADLSEALRLEPKDASVLAARGVVELMRGALDQARADLAEATELSPTRANPALWREIADRRAHAQGRLAEAAEKFSKAVWPAAAVHAFLGEPSWRTMLDEASAAPDSFPVVKQWQICQAYVFTGELALLKDAKAEAAEAFNSAAKACPKGAPERGVVAAELKGLSEKP
jgi:tetratricopeptide (TPR) repeat protein